MTRNSTLNSVVAAEVRAEMARQRKSAVELAQVLNKSKQAASCRLKEKTEIGLNELDLIAAWLDVPVPQLLGVSVPLRAAS